MHYFYLSLAIISEVVATSFIKSTEEYTRLWPSVVVVVGYLFCFYFLALCLRNMSLGVAYAIWCGFGIVLVALVSVLYYKQHLDLAALIGISLILAGTVVINLFSKSTLQA